MQASKVRAIHVVVAVTLVAMAIGSAEEAKYATEGINMFPSRMRGEWHRAQPAIGIVPILRKSSSAGNDSVVDTIAVSSTVEDDDNANNKQHAAPFFLATNGNRPTFKSSSGRATIRFFTNVTEGGGGEHEKVKAIANVWQSWNRQDTVEQVPLFGGRVTTTRSEGKITSRWWFVGLPTAMHFGVRNPNPRVVNSSAPYYKDLGRHKWPNATVAWAALQESAVSRFANHSWWESDSAKAYKTDRWGDCLWVADVEMTSAAAGGIDRNTALHVGVPDDSITVTMNLHSSCNFSAKLVVDREQYIAFAASAADAGAIFGLFGIVAHTGVMIQVNRILTSRAHSQRLSAITYVVLTHMLFCFATVVGELASMVPLASKGLAMGFFWWSSLITATRLMTTAFRSRLDEQPDNAFLRAVDSRGVLYMIISFTLLNIVIVHATFLLPLMSLLGAVLLFGPQVWLNVERDDGIGVSSFHTWSLLCTLSTIIAYLTLYPGNFLSLAPSPVFGLTCIMILLIQGALLEIQRKTTPTAIIPPCWRPKRYVYEVPGGHIPPALAEDAMCVICSDSMVPGTGSGAGSAEQQEDGSPSGVIWVTPCGHYYHRECLLQWMEERMECPVCRTRLPKP